MSQGAWLREAQNDLAVERILTAAGAAFARLGIAGVTMSDVAREAGCSRGTVYRYFKTRDELLIAYVTERARAVSAEVAARTADIANPHDRLVAAILDSVREVRRRPDLAAWFEADQAGHTARLSRRPELFEALAAGFGPAFAASAEDRRQRRAVLRFVVRVVVSLLAMPEESEEAERDLVRRFVVPGILGGDDRRAPAVDEP